MVIIQHFTLFSAPFTLKRWNLGFFDLLGEGVFSW
jgi:hypothetical protein